MAFQLQAGIKQSYFIEIFLKAKPH